MFRLTTVTATSSSPSQPASISARSSPTTPLLNKKAFVWIIGASPFLSRSLLMTSLKQDPREARGCPPIHQVTFDLGAFAITGAHPPVEGVTDAYAPRRKVLDS